MQARGVCKEWRVVVKVFIFLDGPDIIPTLHWPKVANGPTAELTQIDRDNSHVVRHLPLIHQLQHPRLRHQVPTSHPRNRRTRPLRLSQLPKNTRRTPKTEDRKKPRTTKISRSHRTGTKTEGNRHVRKNEKRNAEIQQPTNQLVWRSHQRFKKQK